MIQSTGSINTIAEALDIVKGLSAPSKLPCDSYNIPAVKCHTGSKLRKIPGSVCSDCYALKGLYRKYRKTVDTAQRRRFKAIHETRWIEAMTYLVTARKMPFFRWFDSGDLQSVQHLSNIVEVAINCPDCKFWLPTREYVIVSTFLSLGSPNHRKYGKLPSNLILRLSAHMIDGKPPTGLAKRLGVRTSTVVTDGATCPASNQGGKCLDCRACWDDVENISYKHH